MNSGIFIVVKTHGQKVYSTSSRDLSIASYKITGSFSYDTVRIKIKAKTDLIYPTQHLVYMNQFLSNAKNENKIYFDNIYTYIYNSITLGCFDYEILYKDSVIIYDYLIQKEVPISYNIYFFYFPVYEFSYIERDKRFNESNYEKKLKKEGKCLMHYIFVYNNMHLYLNYSDD